MNQDSQSTAGATKPSHEQIATRAQILWIAEGRPDGRDEAIWLQAEKQLYDEAREIIGSSSSSAASSSQRAPAAEAVPQNPGADKKAPSPASEQMASRKPANSPGTSGKRRNGGR